MKNRYINGFKFRKGHPFRIDSEKVLDMFHTDVFIENGVVRWISNKNIPPEDILEFWNYIGFDFDYELSKKVAEKETAAAIEDYKKNRKALSAEELYEMEAAFGEGATVIDVISGQKIKL